MSHYIVSIYKCFMKAFKKFTDATIIGYSVLYMSTRMFVNYSLSITYMSFVPLAFLFFKLLSNYHC